METLMKWYGEQPTWAKVAMGLGAAAAVVATGGAVAYAIATAETVLVVAGPVVLATGAAASEVAKRL